MKQEDREALWILGGLYLLSKYSFDVVPKLERAGATLYDLIHDDAGHKRDLPMNPLSKTAVLAIATAAGFPDPKLAAAIAYAESGGVPNALASTSREYSVGLWQINLLTHPSYNRDELSDPAKNAAAAFEISQGGTNWRPWTTYMSGKYKMFLNGVLAPKQPPPKPNV